MTQLNDKVVLVTGAGGSIGAAIAHLFAARGASIVVADLDQESVAGISQTIAGGGGRAASIGIDVTDPESVRSAVATTVDRFGGLHVVVNCAVGELPRARAVNVDPGDWRRIIDINLTGSFLVARAALPSLAAQGGGVIILLASQFARVAVAGQAAYCASKGGIVQLAKALALEHAADKVRVNTLSPGAVASARLRRHYGSDEEAEKALGPRHALGRLARPEEVAHAALFLASDDCPFMTGADLLVDGGFTAQ